MEEVGAQVASPIFIHQSLPGRFCDARPMAKKRNLPFQPASFSHENPLDNWNPMSWDWDSARFVARPLQSDVVRGGNATPVQLKVSSQKAVQNNMADPKKPVPVEDKNYNENLRLKLGGEVDGRNGVLTLVEEPQPVSRSNKRVRSGSPGGASYPMCQVDNCKEDLSMAKDYHRRHKVCEVHSKASKASVGKQMQRFCQQCSRFHPLSEFDEGKRSCRRRLAGHNRRRRKTQPDDATSRLLVPENRDKCGNSEVDIANLLAALANAQGMKLGNTENGSKFSSIPAKDQLIQLLDKLNSLKPLPANLAAKLPGCSNGSIPDLVSSGKQSQLNGNVSLPPTVDLLSVLSENPAAPSSDVVEIQSQPSSDRSDSEKSKSAFVDQAASLNLQKGPALEFPSIGGERSSTSYHSPVADSDCHVQETRPNLLLKLFNYSPEDDSLRKLPSGRNYFSSDSSNPSQERSPSSSPPVVYDLFPMHTSRDHMKHDNVSTSEVDTMHAKATTSNQCSTSLKLFGVSTRAAENGSIQSSPNQAGYASSSGSDHSPSSLNSGVLDRNGRIVFKLFDKDPSHLPESLRARIYNWLASSPSEIESYIRPGCIVLSVYLSMSSYAWDQLERNLLDYVKSLVNDINTDFWRNGRFLVHTDKQMASYKDGKIHLCKSWRTWNTPELVLVSPVAVAGGQETSLLLRGRNLTIPGTKIHCTHTNGYSVNELACQETVFDEISLGSFKIHAPSSVLGRCFIEVENGLRGNSFPVIIADNTICQELRLLESVINEGSLLHDGISSDHIQNPVRPRTREEVLHFLDELGWLFQRKNNSSLFESPDYRLSRFKFLLTFSVDHDFCALIKTLLDILLEISLGREGLARESLEMLSETHLLNRAVNRRCRKMVDLLIHYSISDSTDSPIKYIFVPNMAGPGGITPLHLAASTLGSDDMIDALTSDPQEIGLHCWKSVLDANGLSPYAYALMRNNHSYITLVDQKLADKKNFQVSISIGKDIEQAGMEFDHGHKTTFHINQGRKSCSKCAAAAGRYRGKFPGSQGLLQRPYVHSMLVIAAVCACVCLFFRGAPDIGSVDPFKWENLGYGSL
ncbi:squamosa promoter-binding-like protein 14 isoform X1 [Olea europaea var. sylvestris]|uniref:squamosa promoter-binding-like protein 14 isoform X1 n=1 Tax=Olea europaea var. sylvestris TaxID=158386 RepID=UPI000C1D60B0|nr:squamosa promoter-binding-like protein 14 isoform X1 [Olea europaea var. sylvestris]XP_022874033.1 squamosa promoter-binding-like protein 14 isoform X1 [Olea europaea var. sylvestris]